MTASSSDQSSGANDPENTPDSFRVRRAGAGVRLFADTCIVETLAGSFEISLLARASHFDAVVWPADHSQPAAIAIDRVVEEVAKVRLTDEAANDLAMNLLLEGAQMGGFNLDALDRNFAIIREQVASAVAASAAREG